MGIATQFIGSIKPCQKGDVPKVTRQGLHRRGQLQRVRTGRNGIIIATKLLRPLDGLEPGQLIISLPRNEATPHKAIGKVHQDELLCRSFDFVRFSKRRQKWQGQQSPVPNKELPPG